MNLLPCDFHEVVGNLPEAECLICSQPLAPTGTAYSDSNGGWVHLACAVTWNQEHRKDAGGKKPELFKEKLS